MSDWPKEFFEENPELFLDSLEERVAQAVEEVDVLLNSLGKQRIKPKRILDLNCGIGRHSIELAKRGFDVLGTDISPLYIKIAKKRAKEENVAGKVNFKIADMRKIASVLSEKEHFDGIINLFTSFGYYDEKTNDDILQQCLSLVKPGGFFALEILNKEWLIKNFQEKRFSRHPNKIVLEESVFDEKKSYMENVWTYLVETEPGHFVIKKKMNLNHYIWNVQELTSMFLRTGWKFNAVFPGFDDDRKPVPQNAKRLLFIAEK